MIAALKIIRPYGGPTSPIDAAADHLLVPIASRRSSLATYAAAGHKKVRNLRGNVATLVLDRPNGFSEGRHEIRRCRGDLGQMEILCVLTFVKGGAREQRHGRAHAPAKSRKEGEAERAGENRVEERKRGEKYKRGGDEREADWKVEIKGYEAAA
ncbi:hypothetical protein KM043_017209 [Ampulex compressa]|nr:hypothetical protein KM043_017209 [Ampulex compressa]